MAHNEISVNHPEAIKSLLSKTLPKVKSRKEARLMEVFVLGYPADPLC